MYKFQEKLEEIKNQKRWTRLVDNIQRMERQSNDYRSNVSKISQLVSQIHK